MIITLCGSKQFKREFEETSVDLALDGHIVLAPEAFDDLRLTLKQREKLDELQLTKIDMSKAVYVVDVEGCIDERTQKEIEYAKQRGKPVWFWTELHAGLDKR